MVERQAISRCVEAYDEPDDEFELDFTTPTEAVFSSL